MTSLPSSTSYLPVSGVASQPNTSTSADPIMNIPYTMQWNFGVQHSFTPSLTASVDYVGDGARHLFLVVIENTPLLSLMGPGAIAPKTPEPTWPQVNYTMDEATSDYNGLQTKVEKRFSQGLTFLASYTWSHEIDITSTGQSGSGVETVYDIERNYGTGDFDVTHVFVFSYSYALPVGRGLHFGGNWKGPANAILGGWRTSGILSLHSGTPFTVTIPTDNANVNGGQQRAQLVGNPLPSGFTQTINQYYNAAAFAYPSPYTFGNLGRNTLRGPAGHEWDMALIKDFKLTESKSLEFRAESFNLLNNVNFGVPNASVTNPSFMKILSAGAARENQFALKLIW